MSAFSESRPSLPTEDEAVAPGAVRRPVNGTGARVRDFMTRPDTVTAAMLTAACLLILMPWTFIVTGFLCPAFYLWASSVRRRLPFRAPVGWGGVDYGSPKPGRPGQYKNASGILHLGRDERSLEELWIENGDARRHGFFIGTTGSGKALPMDTLVLTPRGWVANADLVPGARICHPDGGFSTVLSVHRQGAVPGVRLHFSDGRSADCSRDHLWHVRTRPGPGSTAPFDSGERGRIMEARDLGILRGLHGGGVEICVPLAAPHEGRAPRGEELSDAHARLAAERGMASLGYMPSVVGTPADRRGFLAAYLRAKSADTTVTDHGPRVRGLGPEDAAGLKRLAWSLGGVATSFAGRGGGMDGGGMDVEFMTPRVFEIHPGAGACRFPNDMGLEITGIEPLEDKVEMSCVEIDRGDGLYVMENHIVTHNTELLIGIVSQTLMWSSGFMFIDGKGSVEFHARAWTLCKRFGREDDLRVLNFTDPGGDPDAPAGGPATQSNTLNPFAKGSPDQLMNIVVSLMGDTGTGGDMWKSRAVSLVTAMMMGLCELRDCGDILLNVQTVRDFLFLGRGFDKDKLRGQKIVKLADVPEDAWEELRSRAGLIELYLRALNGELSTAARLAMKGFFDTLPGFSVEKAMNGDEQDAKTNEQYGFLSMQLTKPLGSLADGYGHIFRTPLGEVDMEDVVLNRRILVVLLPALQKAPDEMQNCGKIVVTLAKIMMGNAAGFSLRGSRREIVEAKQTRAPSPFIVVLDEAGYYMVKGIDVMMAQARSLGFMIIVAGQDMAAMHSINGQIAETAAANASLLAVGKTVDGDRTIRFVQQMLGKATVSVASGHVARPGFAGETKWVDRMDASFVEVERVRLEELQGLTEGQFYFLFNGKLVRASTFHIGEEFAENFSVNKFLKVRGPADRVPGLDQSVEEDFLDGYVGAAEKLAAGTGAPGAAPEMSDGIARIARAKDFALSGDAPPGPGKTRVAWLAGIFNVYGAGGSTQDGARDQPTDGRNTDAGALGEGNFPAPPSRDPHQGGSPDGVCAGDGARDQPTDGRNTDADARREGGSPAPPGRDPNRGGSPGGVRAGDGARDQPTDGRNTDADARREGRAPDRPPRDSNWGGSPDGVRAGDGARDQPTDGRNTDADARREGRAPDRPPRESNRGGIPDGVRAGDGARDQPTDGRNTDADARREGRAPDRPTRDSKRGGSPDGVRAGDGARLSLVEAGKPHRFRRGQGSGKGNPPLRPFPLISSADGQDR